MIRPLQDIEREAIIAACSETKDCQRAALGLGISKTTLYRKLQEYSEDARQFRAKGRQEARERKEKHRHCPLCGTKWRKSLEGHYRSAHLKSRLARADFLHKTPEQNGEDNRGQKPDARNFK
jgi:DNA repair exonuclease SbcCD ATPase subunit